LCGSPYTNKISKAEIEGPTARSPTWARWYLVRRYSESLPGSRSRRSSGGSDSISDNAASIKLSSSVKIPIPARVVIAVRFSGSFVMLSCNHSLNEGKKRMEEMACHSSSCALALSCPSSVPTAQSNFDDNTATFPRRSN
jgi:hypothetical protein